MENIRLSIEDGIATLTFDEPDSPVNTMCLQWQDDLAEAAALLVAEREHLKGIILASAKKTFFAGADLKAVMRLIPADAPRVYAEVERVKKNFRTIETLGLPVVSCINGSALGGGWEVALIGHHRIAVDDPRIELGLPEVSLGLLPGASGVTKMVRQLGLMAAQPYLVEGRLFQPRQGAEAGLVHELVADEQQLRARALAWIAEHPQSMHPWEAKGYKIPGGDARSPKMAAALTVAPAMLKKKTRGLLPAPEAILACMVEGSLVDLETAFRIESRHLAQLMTGGQAQSMINTFFFNMNAVKSSASRPAGVARYKPQKVGIVGAGMMGAGIAWAQASRGIATVLIDTDAQKAQRGKAYSDKLAQQRVSQGRMSQAEQEALLARIEAGADVQALAGCELIIEAVFEQRELKAEVTRRVEPLLAAGGIMASNTSTLPISGLAQASARPESFIGIHFFSPVDKMQLVEIIRGQQTDDRTVAQAMDYVRALGKLPIVVSDARGFYTSRTFGTFVMEGAAMLGEGIPAPVIENAAMQAGMPVGPLAVLDETALTLSVHVLDQTRADETAQGRSYTASAGELLVERMVKQHSRGGRAAGGGFYDYPAGQPKRLWPELKNLFEKPGIGWDLGELKDRLLYRQAVETARCLQEGVLGSVHEANIGSIFGIGFPVWTGGALQFIYRQGVSAFAERCQSLAARHGAGFKLDPSVIACLQAHQPRW
jgi:3-hydroxyacyl-CoA dehydrogenase/enoyl-CoA hydratase/3-hydroxybutyryl-CoA epimerase